MEVTLEQAYAEACQMLGESLVRDRLLAKSQQDPQPQPSSGPLDHR